MVLRIVITFYGENETKWDAISETWSKSSVSRYGVILAVSDLLGGTKANELEDILKRLDAPAYRVTDEQKAQQPTETESTPATFEANRTHVPGSPFFTFRKPSGWYSDARHMSVCCWVGGKELKEARAFITIAAVPREYPKESTEDYALLWTDTLLEGGGRTGRPEWIRSSSGGRWVRVQSRNKDGYHVAVYAVKRTKTAFRIVGFSFDQQFVPVFEQFVDHVKLGSR